MFGYPTSYLLLPVKTGSFLFFSLLMTDIHQFHHLVGFHATCINSLLISIGHYQNHHQERVCHQQRINHYEVY